MKKYLIALLALVMMFALAVPVFAETVGNTEQEVTADYKAAQAIEAAPVYRVTIDWTPGDSALTYAGAETTYTWNPEGLQYTASTTAEAGWTGETSYTVKVTNYSNATVNATVDATASYNLTVEKTHTSDSVTLESAAVDENGEAIKYTETEKKGTAQPETFSFTYKADEGADAPEAPDAGKVTIGTITVTIGE